MEEAPHNDEATENPITDLVFPQTQKLLKTQKIQSKPKRRLVMKRQPYKFEQTLMPGSGAISYTNYSMNSKRNPYLAF